MILCDNRLNQALSKVSHGASYLKILLGQLHHLAQRQNQASLQEVVFPPNLIQHLHHYFGGVDDKPPYHLLTFQYQENGVHTPNVFWQITGDPTVVNHYIHYNLSKPTIIHHMGGVLVGIPFGPASEEFDTYATAELLKTAILCNDISPSFIYAHQRGMDFNPLKLVEYFEKIFMEMPWVLHQLKLKDSQEIHLNNIELYKGMLQNIDGYLRDVEIFEQLRIEDMKQEPFFDLKDCLTCLAAHRMGVVTPDTKKHVPMMLYLRKYLGVQLVDMLEASADAVPSIPTKKAESGNNTTFSVNVDAPTPKFYS